MRKRFSIEVWTERAGQGRSSFFLKGAPEFFTILLPTMNKMKPRKKVLICEDNPVERKVIQMAVGGDHDTFLATDGRKALELLEQHSDFDLVITDIHMPYNNGEDILEGVRRHQREGTPIVMISSDREEEVIQAALKLGVKVFIKKPIDPESVRRKVATFL